MYILLELKLLLLTKYKHSILIPLKYFNMVYGNKNIAIYYYTNVILILNFIYI